MIRKYLHSTPQLTTEQMIEVDRLMIEEYHIELIQMMENAGRCLAIVAAERFLHRDLEQKRVIVLAGTGGNGGGAIVCARRLHNWGAKVRVYTTDSDEKMTPVPRHQLDILQRMGIPVGKGADLSTDLEANLVIDGIIGYSVKGDPYGTPKAMIDWANGQSAPILSLDTPSGLDLTTGIVHAPTVKATATLTLALPKVGLFTPAALGHRGELYLGDISVPPGLYAQPGLNLEVSPNLFIESDVLKLES